jgi:hypothetical protein
MQIDQIRENFSTKTDEEQLLFVRQYRCRRESEFTRVESCKSEKKKRVAAKQQAQSINKNTLTDKLKQLSDDEMALLQKLGLSKKVLKGLE